jgi:SAM-dependent methyltransferase
MPNIEPFESLTEHYDQWFEEHSGVYAEELEAVKALLPDFDNGIEVGVGTGRFAAPLGIRTGLEPSEKMAQIARGRGIEIIPGTAEAMPIPAERYDFVLMVTTICFVDNAETAFSEIYRILRPGGSVIIGFVDKETPLGRHYQAHKAQSRFYKTARFFSAREVETLLKKNGFVRCTARQTLFGETLASMRGGIKTGYGEGAFVAMRCEKDA